MKHAFSGLHYVFCGFRLICKPGLRRFVIIPLLINIGMFTGLFFLLRHFMREFNAWFLHFLPNWLQWLSTVLWLLFFIGFFAVIVYVFVTAANLISAPFNSFLSEKVELHLTGKTPEPRSLWDNIKDVPRIAGRQFSILGYYFPRMILILCLFLVPVIHFIVPVLVFLFNAWFITLTYLDYPTDNHRIPIANVRTWLKEHQPAALVFGGSFLFFSMIPLLNCLVVPAAVAGATQFWIEENRGLK